MEGFDQARQHPRRKRKAESQDNERLSKRLSLLNIGKLRFIDLLIYFAVPFPVFFLRSSCLFPSFDAVQSIACACHPPHVSRRGMIS
jgi:hypothetical protein